MKNKFFLKLLFFFQIFFICKYLVSQTDIDFTKVFAFREVERGEKIFKVSILLNTYGLSKEKTLKLKERFPSGFNCTVIEPYGSTTVVSENSVLFVWSTLPKEDLFVVKYELSYPEIIGENIYINGSISFFIEGGIKFISVEQREFMNNPTIREKLKSLRPYEPGAKQVADVSQKKEKEEQAYEPPKPKPRPGIVDEPRPEEQAYEPPKAEQQLEVVDESKREEQAYEPPKIEQQLEEVGKARSEEQAYESPKIEQQLEVVDELNPKEQAHVQTELFPQETKEMDLTQEDQIKTQLIKPSQEQEEQPYEPPKPKPRVEYLLKEKTEQTQLPSDAELTTESAKQISSKIELKDKIESQAYYIKQPTTPVKEQEVKYQKKKAEQTKLAKSETKSKEKLAKATTRRKAYAVTKSTTSNEISTGFFYTIQVGASTNPKDINLFHKYNFEYNLFTMTLNDKYKYKFCVGKFLTFSEAKEYYNVLNSKGIVCFITAYNNGERISIKEALKISKK